MYYRLNQPPPDLLLAIPTNRVCEVADTVRAYTHNAQQFGHAIPVVVFDNSLHSAPITTLRELSFIGKHYPGQVMYVGNVERQGIIDRLTDRFPKEMHVISQLFGHHYGGSRNLVLAYTVGGRAISIDDDVRPMGLYLPTRRRKSGILAWGRYVWRNEDICGEIRPQNMITGVMRFLGTSAGEHASTILTGKDVIDSDARDPARDRCGPLKSHVSQVLQGQPMRGATISYVQMHIAGDVDIEADYLLQAQLQSDIYRRMKGTSLPSLYFYESNEAIISANSRLTGAALGIDNINGALYFLPTQLRCEDYIIRLYLQLYSKIACAYSNVTQTHRRSGTNRLPMAHEWFNEQLAWALIVAMYRYVTSVTRLRVHFNVTELDVSCEAREIASRTLSYIYRYSAAISKAKKCRPSNDARLQQLTAIEKDLARIVVMQQLHDFTTFSHRLHQSIRSELMMFNRIAELWPELIEFLFDIRRSFPWILCR